MKAAVILLFLLTLQPSAGNCQPPASSGHTSYRSLKSDRNTLIKKLVCKYADKYKVKRSSALAVAHIESRKLDRHGNVCQEFREGKHGRYWLPMGIFDPADRLGVDDLETNIEVGVRALTRYGPVTNAAELKKVLRKYNASFDGAYWGQIKKAEALYELELVNAQYLGNLQ